MEGNNIRIVIVGTLVAIYLILGCPNFLHNDSGYISLVHHFFHANIFHLVVNCFSICVLFKRGVQYRFSLLLTSYLIGTLSWYCSPVDPVGFSNIIFAYIGLRTPPLDNPWWRHPAVITFFTITLVMSFLPHVSGVTHITSLILGCIVSGLNRILRNIGRDYDRASYN